MVLDITLYKDRAKIQYVYNNGDATEWIEYPEGTKEKAIDQIERWHSVYANYLHGLGITLAIHDHDYFSTGDGQQ